MSEPTSNAPAPNNSRAIHFIVATVCLATVLGVGTEAYCVLNRIPDMGGPIMGGFTHTVDTLVGALIAMLINTRPQEQRAAEPSTPTQVTIANTPEDPANVQEVKHE